MNRERVETALHPTDWQDPRELGTAMAQASMVPVPETRGNLARGSTNVEPVPIDRPIKLKGRKKLLRGLQRISSSPSILRLHRSSSTSYRSTGTGSISCVSFSSSSASPYSHTLENAYGVLASNGYSTAPTSIPGTPGFDTPTRDHSTRIHFATPDAISCVPRTPLSVSLQAEIKVFSRTGTPSGVPTIEEDYFSCPTTDIKPYRLREGFDFWGQMPAELKLHIFRLLKPREIIRCSAVSKFWHKMSFDGQLWANLDTADYYRDIPAEALITIITNSGPFVRDLNLRGCVQLWECWRSSGLSDACRNLENVSLEGCRIDRSSIHTLLYQNPRLVHVNLSGLASVTNSTMKIIAQYCPKLEHLDISWCNSVDTRGIMKIIQSCQNLRDLRAGEVRGFEDRDFMLELFTSNTLERLILQNCDSLTDDSLTILVEGIDSEIDFLTGRCIVPPRNLKHLDLSRCRNITDAGLISLAHHMPFLEGLQLSKCRALTDISLIALFPTLLRLSHLDLEELDLLSNASLQELAKSPCSATLQHLSISYCENLGDVGMLPVVKACTNLRNLDLDNTRISDLVLAEAANMVRQRCHIPSSRSSSLTPVTLLSGLQSVPRPRTGLRMVVYDCQNVTWTGIREVLSRNAEIRRPLPMPMSPLAVSSLATHTLASDAINENVQSLVPPQSPAPQHSHQIIALKVFYGYQPTVTEHTRRVLRGDLAAASRLDRKWAEYMMASEEAGPAGGVVGGGFGLGGYGNRRRRRRAREAQMMHADEEGGEPGSGGVGRRRRARSGGGCFVM